MTRSLRPSPAPTGRMRGGHGCAPYRKIVRERPGQRRLREALEQLKIVRRREIHLRARRKPGRSFADFHVVHEHRVLRVALQWLLRARPWPCSRSPRLAAMHAR
jgi:hypothetical protein